MEFIAKSKLVHWISKVDKSFMIVIIIGLSFLFFFSFAIYNVSESLIITIIGLFGSCAYLFVVIYIGPKNRAEIINNTISRVEISEGEVLFITFPYNSIMLKKEPKYIKTAIGNIRISKDIYPLRDSGIMKEKALIIHLKGTTYYLLNEFFDKALTEALSFKDVH